MATNAILLLVAWVLLFELVLRTKVIKRFARLGRAYRISLRLLMGNAFSDETKERLIGKLSKVMFVNSVIALASLSLALMPFTLAYSLSPTIFDFVLSPLIGALSVVAVLPYVWLRKKFVH